MKKITIAVLVFALVGCDSNISGSDVARANAYCADKGGIHSFDTIARVAWCRDGDGSNYQGADFKVK